MGRHLTFEQIARFNRSELSEEESVEVRRHIESCDKCRRIAGRIRDFSLILSEVFSDGKNERTSDCLTDIEMAAYLDGNTSVAERAKIEGHLQACQLCLAEVVELKKASREVVVVEEPFIKRVQDRVFSRIEQELSLTTAAKTAKALILWHIIRKSGRANITFRIQLAKTGIRVLTPGYEPSEALPIVGYERRMVRRLGKRQEVHSLRIPLPERSGHVDMTLQQIELNVISLSVQMINAADVPVETKVDLSGELYKRPQHLADRTTTVYPQLFADRYRIRIAWEDRTWEIPLEVVEADNS